MKSIELGRGVKTIVDDEDFGLLSQFNWRPHRSGKATIYAVWRTTRNKKAVRVFMHKLLLGVAKGQCVDHINRESLDNRKANLRLCSAAENNRNVEGKRPKIYSAPRGVSWHKSQKRWRARIRHCGKEISLGYFESSDEAAMAYNLAAKKLHGDFAILNQQKEKEPHV